MRTYARRGVLAAIGTLAVAGCVSDGSDGPADSNNGGATPAREPPTSTDDKPADSDEDDTEKLTDRDFTGTDNHDDSEQATSENEPSDGGEQRRREENLARLPTPGPLSNTLVMFFKAEDRAAFARSRDLQYEDGKVRVSIRLEPDGKPPEQYLPADWSGYDTTIIAFVDADDLVDIALDENVRLVTTPSPPNTDDDRDGPG